MNKKIATAIIVIISCSLGFVAGYFTNSFIQFSRSSGISEKRMNELTRGPCEVRLRGINDPVIKLLQKAYNLQETEHEDLEIKSINECRFNYVLESDFQGVAKVIFSPRSKGVNRVEFYSRNDDSLWTMSGPSFVASLFSDDKRNYLYDGFRGRMYVMEKNNISSFKEIGQGAHIK